MASNSNQSTGAPATANSTQSAGSSAAASNQQSIDSGHVSGNTVSAIGPDDVLFTTQYVNDNSWPADFELDINLGNWPQWNRHVTLLSDRQGFTDWLNGTLSRPPKATHAKAHHIWAINDRSLKAFLLSHISQRDYDSVCTLPTAHSVFEALQKTHENQGLHAKLVLLKQAIDTRFQPGVPLDQTMDDIRALHKRIIRMGPIDDDELLSIILINALNGNFESLQSNIMSLSQEANFSSQIVERRLTTEANLIRRRTEQNPAAASTVLAAQSLGYNGKPRSLCTHCKKPGHLADFCIHPGGKMAGRPIEEARNAQRAASGKSTRDPKAPQPATAKVATSDSSAPSPSSVGHSAPSADSVIIGGVTYYPGPSSQSSAAYLAHTQTARIETLSPDTDSSPGSDYYSYHSYLALGGSVTASVDWDSHVQASDPLDSEPQPVLSVHARALLSRPVECPFILDSGASHHISPERSDFKTLRPIAPHPIQGFNGSSTSAIGIGDIDLCVASGHKLSLKDVLFVPSCSTRLVSVSALTQNGYNFVTFGPADCWLSDKHDKIIIRGSLSITSGLYVLNCPSARVTHTKPVPIPSPSALYAKRVPDLETWHRRLGHCGNRTITDMARDKVVKGMPIDLSTSPPVCDSCILGKQTRSSVPKTREGIRATSLLGRVYVDLCGPMPVTSRSGRRYSMNLIDDHSGYVWSLPLKLKSEASSVLRGWHRAVENQSGHKLKILVTDNGELASKSMADWCTEHGIDHQFTAPYTSAQNGRVERLHRTILGRARSMRLACNAPASLWDEFCATAAYLANLTASSSLNGRTPHELWFGKIPSLSHLREIGCRAFALIQTNNPKIFRRSTPCTMIGYAPHSKAYRLWDNTNGAIFNSFHVTFIEHLDSLPTDLLPGKLVLLEPDAPPSWEVPSPNQSLIQSQERPSHATPSAPRFIPSSSPIIPTELPTSPSPSIPIASPSSPVIHPIPTITIPPINIPPAPPQNRLIPPIIIPPAPPESRLPRRSKRLAERSLAPTTALLAEFSKVSHSHDIFPLSVEDTSLPVDYVLSAIADGSLEPVSDTGDDPSWAEALASKDKEYWIAGAREEIQSLKDLQVYVLVPRSSIPTGRRPMRGKLVCKRKRDDSGTIKRYKVRYVAKGYAQQYGVDYDKTTAPTARLESFRVVLHIAASLDWDLQQFDIKTAFLHGVLPPDETAYMEQPPGFEEPGKEDHVMQLQRSIYGMKQASRIWNKTFHETVTGWGFKRMKNEWCVYRRDSDTGTTIFALHVDDIIAASSSVAETHRFKSDLTSRWEISDLGPAKFALGIAITRDRASRTISISQSAFIDRILEKFGQSDSHPCDIPTITGLKLTRPSDEQPVPPHITAWMARTPYRELIGSLNYLAVASRPDISYAVGRLASFLNCYRESHWSAAIRVLKYVKGTRSLCMTLGGDLSLAGYADSDFANCPETSRSISGYCFSLGQGMVSWSSKKQKHATDSTCYAEYIALHHAGKELVFLRELLEGLGHTHSSSSPLACDNDTARLLTDDPSNHANVKHIRTKYHTTRDLVDDGYLHVIRTSSTENTADIFTKPLGRDAFQYLRHKLGLRFA
jgi:transposase InsO family protein